MANRLFIIHGWEAFPEANWFPWLKQEAQKIGFIVNVPSMPNTNKPEEKEWVLYLQKLVGQCDENTYFVGHSLGVIAILRFLEKLSSVEKVGGIILVAGFSEKIMFPELNNFFVQSVNYSFIKEKVKNIVAIHSDNDPFVPLEFGKKFEKNFGAELIIMPNSDHLNAGDGSFRLPIALEKLKEWINFKG